jgi:hypothetical protein
MEMKLSEADTFTRVRIGENNALPTLYQEFGVTPLLIAFDCYQYAITVFDKQDRPAIDRACLGGFVSFIHHNP